MNDGTTEQIQLPVRYEPNQQLMRVWENMEAERNAKALADAALLAATRAPAAVRRPDRVRFSHD